MFFLIHIIQILFFEYVNIYVNRIENHSNKYHWRFSKFRETLEKILLCFISYQKVCVRQVEKTFFRRLKFRTGVLETYRKSTEEISGENNLLTFFPSTPEIIHEPMANSIKTDDDVIRYFGEDNSLWVTTVWCTVRGSIKRTVARFTSYEVRCRIYYIWCLRITGILRII